jgi:hypothetical protein
MICEETQNGHCIRDDESAVEGRHLDIINDNRDLSTTTTSQYKQESRAPAKRSDTASQVKTLEAERDYWKYVAMANGAIQS